MSSTNLQEQNRKDHDYQRRWPDIEKADLIEIIKQYKSRTYSEDLEKIQELGGTEAIAKKLGVDISQGIKEADKEDRATEFGSNFRKPADHEAWCTFLKQQLGDTMLIILIVAAFVSLILSYLTAEPEAYGHAWIEGGGILIAVAVVSITGSTVDYQKDCEFVKQTNDDNKTATCTILRNGELQADVHHDHVVTGDIIQLQVGLETPVDGIVTSAAQLQTNEAAMTGESDERKKETHEACYARLTEKNHLSSKNTYAPTASESHSLPSPVILSGTSCAGGEGRYLALVVGDDSALGEILKNSHKRPQTTPLEEKLDQIAADIGVVGVVFALLTVHGLMLIYFIDGLKYRNVDLFGGEEEGDALFSKNLKIWVDYFIIGVAIIVVAVPEGLPLAVMISLAYSIKRMLKDKNYVKRLASCEIMGGADNICSDKTGTLTMNKMTVTNVYCGTDIEVDQTQVGEGEDKKMSDIDLKQQFNEVFADHIITAIACNTPERTSAGATDKGMLELIDRGKINQAQIQEKHKINVPGEFQRFPFSSKRKRMSTIISNAKDSDDGYNKRLLIKGASEIVKRCCSHYLDKNGDVQQMTDAMSEQYDGIIQSYAENALRTICIAYKDIEENQDGPEHDEPKEEEIKNIETAGLTLICILGIMDIVRTEVPEAVRICEEAGVTVRMVTGDNIITARAIAKNCGIIKEGEELNDKACVEGPEFSKAMGGLINEGEENERVKNMKEFRKYIPHLKVMARSRPEDKYLLVTGLKNCGATVAVTGDGTNDAMALRKADVGFGMGIAGTQTCKKAADIIIQDDSFHNVVKACSWGRNVFDNIQRFLQFQLTVNVNALFTVLISSLVTGETPLHAIQLLWVNMIMDSLAALALATEMPKPELLKRPPQNREDHIVSRKMLKHIMLMAIWMCITIYFFVFYGENVIPESDPRWQYDRPGCCVFPGRGKDWDDEPLYSPHLKEDGDSRHMTWIFHFFVFMQIWNMICARKIHDEWNLCEGLFSNVSFVLVWLFIFLGQIGISFSGRIFRLHPDGLDVMQHVTAVGLALSVFIIDVIAKALPDWIIPFGLGSDHVFEKAYPPESRWCGMCAKKDQAKDGAVDDEAKAAADPESGVAINDDN